MKEMFRGCTVFNVAHWDSPLQVNDLELFIEKGKLENAWQDQEQREILAREQAFEAKVKESTTKDDGEKILEGLVGLPVPTEGDASKARSIHPLERAHRKPRAESPKDATGPPCGQLFGACQANTNEPARGSARAAARLESTYRYPSNRCIVVLAFGAEDPARPEDVEREN
ncbi:hypothetical protein MY1884_004835 [Beauveria asiatica]